jgi:septal ring factor EnvC (AmiA/AmiB activator)
MAERERETQLRRELEHVYAQMFEVLRRLQRVERKLQKYRQRIADLECRLEAPLTPVKQWPF